MEFQIQDLLHEENICTDFSAASKEEAINKIEDIAYANGYVRRGYAKDVISREQLYPTALPTTVLNVAIPHPIEQTTINKSTFIIMKLNKPVDFIQMGSDDIIIPVKMIFALAISGSKHQLTILQNLISLFSNQEAMERISAANTPHEIASTITELLE